MSNSHQASDHQADSSLYPLDPRMFDSSSSPYVNSPAAIAPTNPYSQNGTAMTPSTPPPKPATTSANLPRLTPPPPFASSERLIFDYHTMGYPTTATHPPYLPAALPSVPQVPKPLPYAVPIPHIPPPSAGSLQPISSPLQQAPKWRKTRLRDMTQEQLQARQTLLASHNSDRQVYLDLLKEPDHGGLAPHRVEELNRVFRHHILSSLPGSDAGVEKNKMDRMSGMAEIALLRAQRAEKAQTAISWVASPTVSRGGIDDDGAMDPFMDGNIIMDGDIVRDDDIISYEDHLGEEDTTDGTTRSYSLNGHACTKKDLDSHDRYPPPVASTEVLDEDRNRCPSTAARSEDLDEDRVRYPPIETRLASEATPSSAYMDYTCLPEVELLAQWNSQD